MKLKLLSLLTLSAALALEGAEGIISVVSTAQSGKENSFHHDHIGARHGFLRSVCPRMEGMLKEKLCDFLTL